jgi:hypothetical protein
MRLPKMIEDGIIDETGKSKTTLLYI